MNKLFPFLVTILICLIFLAGCTGNNSKKVNTEIISKEPDQPLQVTTVPTSQITTISTSKITTEPTSQKTTIPTSKITITPTYTQQPSKSNSESCPVGKCWVNSYTKKDGTKVRGYCRKC